MPNMKQKISNRNFKVKKTEEERQPTYGCNCTRAMGPCPLGGKCLVNSVVYKAEVVENNSTSNTYTGLTSNTFEQIFYRHRHSFHNRNSEHSITLSSHKKIKRNIINKKPPFNPTTKKCRICLKEKFHILYKADGASLNKRSEIFNTCRHRTQKLLENAKT